MVTETILPYGGYNNRFKENKQRLREGHLRSMDVPFVYPQNIIPIAGFIHNFPILTLVENYLESSAGQKLIDKKIEERLQHLSIEEECIDMSRNLSDKEAKYEIISYLENMKNKGVTQINLLDLISYLNIPGEQIERIMDELQSKGVKPVDCEDI